MILAGGLLVLALLIAILVPTLGASIVRSKIAGAASDSIAGEVEIGGLGLSWTGSQRISGLRVLDESGWQVASLDGTLQRGLLSLVFSPTNLGEITLSGSARLEKGPSGQFTILEATKPSKPALPPSDKPAKLPSGLNATINIDTIDIELIEDDRSSHIRGLRGGGTIRPGQPVTLALASESIEHAGNTAGSITLNATLASWSDRGGTITPEAAAIDAELRMEDVPSDLARAIAGLRADLASGLGSSFTLITTAKGSATDLTASLEFTAEHARTSARVHVAADVIELAEPLRASGQALRLARAVPGLAGALETAEQTLEFQSDPEATLTIDALRVPRTESGLALDQASASARVELPLIDARLSVDDERHDIALSPTTATVTLAPESGLAVTSSGSATMDGRDAGRFQIAASLARLFDDAGNFTFDAQQLAGEVSIDDADTALAQPWIGDTVDLSEAIGPALSARVAVEARGSERLANLAVNSERATASGSLILAERLIRSTDQPLRFSLHVQPDLIRALLGKDAPVELTAPATLAGELANLRIDLDRLNEPDRMGGAIAGTAMVRVEGAPAIRLTRDGAAPMTIASSTIRAALTPAGVASTSGDLRLQRDAEPFEASFELAQIDLTALLERRYAASGVRGSAALRDAPVSLLSDLGVMIRDANGEPVDLNDLAAQTVGERVSGSLSFEPRADDLALTGSLALADLTGELSGSLGDTTLRIDSASADGAIRPRTLQALLDTFVPTLDPQPRIAGQTAFHIAIGPTLLGLDAGDIAQTLDATVTLERADLRGLGLKMADDDRRFLGPVLLDGLTAKVALQPGEARDTTLALSLALLDESETSIGAIALDVTRTAGAIKGSANLQGVSLALADRLLQSPGLVTGAAGPTLSSDIEFDLTDGVFLSAAVDTERLETTDRISLALREREIEVGPVHASIDLDGSWLSEHIAPSLPISMSSRTRLVLDADTTRLPRAGHAGPLAFDARVRTDRLALALESGEGEMLNDLDVHVRTDPQMPNLVRLDAGALRAMSEPGSRAIEATGTLQLARDPAGTILPDESVLNLRASANNAPIDFLDALLDQGGVLSDLAGGVASAEFVAEDLTKDRGGVRLSIDTPTTTVNLRGRVRDATFRARPIDEGEQAQIRVASFTPQLSSRISEIMPLLSGIEKDENDRPATLTIKRLELPLDGDLSKLNANVDLDLGTAGFRASRAFAPFLKALSWDVDAQAGKRLKPINLRARDGVVLYRDVRIPLGEFTIRLDGQVDLASRSIDAVTYLPFGSLSAEFGADIQGQIARVLGPLGVAPDMNTLQVPIRLSGPMGSPQASLAGDLFVESLRSSFKPEDLLRGGLDEALKRIGGG